MNLDNHRLLIDEKYYIENLLWIRTKVGGVRRFVLNWPQNYIWQRIQKAREERKLLRFIVAKARQEGVSTFDQGFCFSHTATKAARRAFVLAHKLDSSIYLFKMSKLFYQRLPKQYKPMCRPPSKRELDFSNPDSMAMNLGLLSSFFVGTATSPTEGMSQTIHDLHASEFAEWPRPMDVWGVLAPAVPDTSDSFIMIESTGKLWGDDFYTMYMDAKNGKNDFINIFLPWNIMPEYSRPAPEKFKLTKEEEELKRTHDLTLDQLYWRRQTIITKYGGDVNRFRRFYPITEEECFIMSGISVFDEDVVLEYLKKCTDPQAKGVLSWSDRPVFERRDGGYCSVWKPPQDGKHYIISCDPSAGFHRESDAAAVNVLCVEDFSQDAVVHGRFEPKEMAYLLRNLCVWYNEGLCIPEANAPGLAVLTVLKEIYPHIYQRQVTPDSISKPTEPRLGWFTSIRNRPLLFSTLNQVIGEKELILRDKNTVLELRNFYLDDNQNPVTKKKMPDDRTFALMIGIMGYLHFLGARVPSDVKEMAQSMLNPKIYDDDKEGRVARLDNEIEEATARGMSLEDYRAVVDDDYEAPDIDLFGSGAEVI